MSDRNGRNMHQSNQALSRHMLTQFLSARESFNPQTIEDDFNAVRVLSTPEVYQQDKDYLAKNNPDSPFNLLKSGTRSIKVDRIILIKTNQAIIFFTETDNVGAVITVHQVSADIDFRYTSLALTNSEAETINPVGFQVTGYRVQTATLLGVDNEKVAHDTTHA